MTPRTLFNIILKIIGLLFIRDMITVIRELAEVNLYLRGGVFEYALFSFLGNVITLGVYVAISYFLIFKSDYIIDKLRLDQGFEEEHLSLNLHRSVILSIALIVVGGIMMAESIPSLLIQLFNYVQDRKTYYREPNGQVATILITVFKLIIGMILVFNQRQIVNAIELNRKK
jgi:hypothetical protein